MKFLSGRSLKALADEDLMQRISQHDADAFRILYDRHQGAAYSLAYRVCGQRSTAEDVVQEAFHSLWKKSASYHSGRGSLRSWLLSLVHNQAVDTLRRQSAHTRSAAVHDPQTMQEIHEANESPVENRMDDEMIEHMKHLPQEQQQVILLSFYGGFTHSEISEMMSIPSGTVKSRMRSGMQSLKTRLETENV